MTGRKHMRGAIAAWVAISVAAFPSLAAELPRGTPTFQGKNPGGGCDLDGNHYNSGATKQVVEQDPNGKTRTITIVCTEGGWVKK
jgi:hypothetical protein